MKKTKSVAKPNFVNKRKAVRKQKREQKKANRKEHYVKRRIIQNDLKTTPGQFVKRPALSPEPDQKKKPKSIPTIQDILKREQQKEKKAAESLKSQMEEQRRKMLLKANEDEDKMIKKLEKQLGLNKSKNKNSYFADDGLDYLLEICDRNTTEQIVAAEKHLADVEDESDFEEDLAVVTGKELDKKVKSKMINQENNDDMEVDDDKDESGSCLDTGDEIDSEDSEMSEESDDEPIEKPTHSSKSTQLKNKIKEDETFEKTKNVTLKVKKLVQEKVVSEEELSKVFSDDEVSNLSGDDESNEYSDEQCDETENDEISTKNKEKPDVWEDIYGRKRDKDGNVIQEEKGVYIPPHLRNKDASSDMDLTQLKRQIKSVLNKLAGSNLHWACNSIENLYSQNSRNAVNSALTSLWKSATVTPTATSDRLVAEHAALVAVLHANVATEIGAHFLQDLCKHFDDLLNTNQPMGDKTLDNVVSCLSHLYSFKIFHATLLYDILNRLLEEIKEKNIDCVLVALRVVGGVLRKEEPLALKNFIHETQSRVTALSDSLSHGSRIKFLLDVLLAVKNNNLNKIPNYDPSYVEELKKMIKTIIRKGNYITPMNIRLDDLLKADERGKWWIVGSAWEGNHTRPEEKTVKLPATNDHKLLELARKQRMNTDVRRSIFCVIMSAEDFMDAFEKLQHLGLRGQQEREIVHVLLACCLNEKSYNPYYAVLGQKLCDTDRKYQLAIQFSVWDKIKDIETLPKTSLTNLAQFLVHLIMEKGLPLSVLKVIQFSDLNKSTLRFMRQILLAIIMNEDLQSSLEVFYRISKPPKLHMFRESLRLFVQHFLVKNAGKQNSVLSDEEMETLKERAVEVDKILTMHESKLKL